MHTSQTSVLKWVVPAESKLYSGMSVLRLSGTDCLVLLWNLRVISFNGVHLSSQVPPTCAKGSSNETCYPLFLAKLKKLDCFCQWNSETQSFSLINKIAFSSEWRLGNFFFSLLFFFTSTPTSLLLLTKVCHKSTYFPQGKTGTFFFFFLLWVTVLWCSWIPGYVTLN